jgi:hypothetical protein
MKISVMKGNKAEFEPVEVKDVPSLIDTITKQTYSLGTFANNHRTNENFQGSQFVGLDIDGGMSLAEARLAFAGYEHIIATTKSHQKPKGDAGPCDRFRVILSIDKFIDNMADYKATVLTLLEKYPAADEACSDAARMFFKSNEVISVNESGKKIEAKKYIKPVSPAKNVSTHIKGNLGQATLAFIALGTDYNWNNALYKAAIDLHEQQYTKEDAIQMLTLATRNYDGELNGDDLATIDSAFKKEPDHAPRTTESMFSFKHPTEMKGEGTGTDWFVADTMGRGAISILAGPPKSGKSTLTRQLAIAAAQGGEWIGRKVEKVPVLYLALEEQEGMLKHQLSNLGLTKEDPIFMHCGRAFPGNIKENLVAAINQYNAGLVIIDTMLLLSTFTDINSYNEAYAQLNPFREVARETNAHLLMIHHTNKSGTMMGSQGLLAAVDCGMTLSTMLGESSKRKIDSLQRGGRPFTDCVLEYNRDLDIYIKAISQKREF